ncbi:hypothetical protein QNO07_05425 [Streptomyces sp. 549]|uniref:hypothetical protein n=1 Tax=Streptomyces sp. 549 TaxID=3049076 RepID=UPI0024C344C9|nr:hypothetical protein [Streptomyces sp. 549]MDK1472876.1 hypothetical protein [Streptomyces sp. 549]
MRSPFAVSRMLKHAPAVRAGLPPAAALELDPDDPALHAARLAASAGDHRPAARLLAASRQQQDWALRSTHVWQLAKHTEHHPGWLDTWLNDSPQDPDALLVKSAWYIHHAWTIRTGHRAKDVAEDRFRAFFSVLHDAVPTLSEAARLNPGDPVPLQLALTHCRGIQAPREVFESYWAEALRRDPDDFDCHQSALQYLCDKWYGSHEEMFAFAERAAETAPEDSKLRLLPLIAAIEYVVVSEDDHTDGPVTEERVEAAIACAQALAARCVPGDPRTADVHNHLALVLSLWGRPHEALERFRAAGTHVTEFPWAYLSDEARTVFLEHREEVCLQIAADVPLFGTPPAPPAPPLGNPAADRDAAPATGAPAASASGTTADPAAASAPGSQRVWSLAVAAARPDTVAEGASMSGVPLRVAPAGSAHSHVERAPDTAPAKRSGFGAQTVTDAAGILTTGETWPTLVLHRSGERHGFSLVHKGKLTASHWWDPRAGITDHAEATATAEALALAYDLPDARPLTRLLRGSGDPRHQLDALLTALALPALPEGLDDRPEVLATTPGTRLVARRGLREGFHEALSGADARSATPTSATTYRTTGWWLLRSVGLVVLTGFAVYAWWSPDIGWFRAVLATLGAFYLAKQLINAVLHPGRGA